MNEPLTASTGYVSSSERNVRLYLPKILDAGNSAASPKIFVTARELECAVRIQHPASRDPSIRHIREEAEHDPQGVLLNDRVGIDQEKEFSACEPERHIVCTCKPDVRRVLKKADSREFRPDHVRAPVIRRIVNDKYLPLDTFSRNCRTL